MSKTNNVDMLNGPLWGKILKFSGLFILTAFLQQLYSAADVVVVGRYAGQEALAGVGTCTVIVNLFVNFILGLSAGATIVLGHAIGGGNRDKISRASHTAFATAICSGVVIMIICLSFTEGLLRMIDVPENVMPEASVYLRIISFGFIPSLIYNFGAGILRAKGDTKRALYIVTASGIINVLLNLLFVCVFGMSADGVAIATVSSQVFTAVAMIYIFLNENDETRINISKLRIYKEPFLKILRLGLPSGIQSAVYSISNVLVQSSVNSFGSAAIAGSAAVTSVTNFYNAMSNGLYHAAIVFTGQNFGAKKFERIRKVVSVCFVYVLALWVIQSAVTFFLGKHLIALHVPGDSAALEMGMRKIGIIGYTYVFLSLMNIMSGTLRGMGASFINMVSAIVGTCGIRIVWIMTVFDAYPTFECLYLCYPLSWAGTFVMHGIMAIIVFKKHSQ